MAETKEVLHRYNRYSHVYDLFESIMEWLVFKKWRGKVFSKVEGRCLEVGFGTGKNFSYYPKDESVSMVAIDLSPGMAAKSKKRATGVDVDLILMDAQHLAFKDNVFDSVVMTFVLCSIPDPVKGVEECVRVCKPDGKIINLEHIRTKNRLIAFMQDLMNPITYGLFGFNVNRNTRGNIEKGGATIVEDRNMTFTDIFRLLVSKPNK
ncbi:Methyltransferase domain-containing protein [Methanococcoides vulcani]|uniref:Methyltransferase domain-containing protein n=1 Tax=Methanococcoides vulcani TaxID=1353158 RepID=A0A1I0AFB5_9EURY|nr:class I SAM-dependent methyltransferase [Methanococcoides vulcani]SES92894.1 Methyltransferase domain-containing protein [Methanococcoides vulcani]